MHRCVTASLGPDVRVCVRGAQHPHDVNVAAIYGAVERCPACASSCIHGDAGIQLLLHRVTIAAFNRLT